MKFSNPSKYHSHKIKAEGLTFDSRKEYARWKELCLMERTGAIQGLHRQVKYVLIPAQYGQPTTGPRGGTKKGQLLERECAYIADFVYQKDGETVVEDTKGVVTPEYVIKRKMMLYKYGIRIQET